MTDDELRVAVSSNRSWRGVLRAAGRTSPRYGRELKARCDDLGISYEHFRAGPSDDVARQAVLNARSWDEAVVAAGYAENSGSARAQLRERCALMGVHTGHLLPSAVARRDGQPGLQHLRDAGALLVASFLTMHGYAVSWPMEPTTYDLVAGMPEGLQRVQVKTTTSRDGGTWQCGLTRSGYDGARGYSVGSCYVPGELDWFGVVDGDLFVYLIPYAIVQGQTTIHTRKYAEFRLAPPRAGGAVR